jgi:hypothetical protein
MDLLGCFSVIATVRQVARAKPVGHLLRPESTIGCGLSWTATITLDIYFGKTAYTFVKGGCLLGIEQICVEQLHVTLALGPIAYLISPNGGRVIGLPSSLIQFISLNGPCTLHPSLHEGASSDAEVSRILARERVFALALIRE